MERFGGMRVGRVTLIDGLLSICGSCDLASSPCVDHAPSRWLVAAYISSQGQGTTYLDVTRVSISTSSRDPLSEWEPQGCWKVLRCFGFFGTPIHVRYSL